jgi:hypothetical protein
MNKSQQVRFESLYRKHVSALKRQRKADKTIDVYARAVRRVANRDREVITPAHSHSNGGRTRPMTGLLSKRRKARPTLASVKLRPHTPA